MALKRTRADGLKTREAILAAAAEEFAAKGFELGSMRAICANAGRTPRLRTAASVRRKGSTRLSQGDSSATSAPRLQISRKELPTRQAGVRTLLAMALDDEDEIELWASSIWAQVSAYALADKKWHASFHPKGAKPAGWRAKVGEHISNAAFAALTFKEGE